jgi:hypothetical protein
LPWLARFIVAEDIVGVVERDSRATRVTSDLACNADDQEPQQRAQHMRHGVGCRHCDVRRLGPPSTSFLDFFPLLLSLVLPGKNTGRAKFSNVQTDSEFLTEPEEHVQQ